MKKQVVSLRLDSLVFDGNLREHVDGIAELAQCIREVEQVEAITVRRNADGRTYRVVNGGRRVRALRQNGATHVDAIIDEEPRSDGEVFLRQLVGALQSESYKPGEVAKGLAETQRLLGLNQSQLAAKLGKSEGFVSKKLMLLLLPPALLAKVDAGDLPESSGYLIAKESDATRQKELEAMAVSGASRDTIAGAAKENLLRTATP